MAQRKVKRSTSGKQAVVRHYGASGPFDLPDWVRDWVVANIGWVVLITAVILAPAVALAAVLGFHSLPLEFLGVSGTENSIGLTAVSLMLKFVLLVLAVRPLFDRRTRGWQFLIAAAIVHFIHSLFLKHAISGAVIALATVYVYSQVRRNYH